MVTHHNQPAPEWESDKIKRALDILKGVVERENKRHMMDVELTHGMMDLLESEVIPQLENELEYDPTPYYLSD